MERIICIYNKYRNFIERVLFPALLFLYPLTGITRGIDVADTTYSLSNFQYFNVMDGTWMVATYLANVAGFLLMQLPFGNTLPGIYLYTALVQSLTALAAYVLLCRKLPVKIPAPLVFVGEWIALGLCWCPSTILYNYLTYLFMMVGILLLYCGILREDRRYYVAAGICLGANVAVRMPNVVQMALIVALWYGSALLRRTWQQAVQDTLWCVLGYGIGFVVPLVAICLRYGVGAYPDMVRTMFAMTEKAEDYKPTAMITGMFGDYMTGLFWLAFAAICMVGGFLLFALRSRVAARASAGASEQKSSGAAIVLCRLIYVAVLLVLLRFYWGKGVFNFLYYDYGSMYYPAVFLLLVTLFVAIRSLLRRNVRVEQKIMAVLVIVQIFVTPLGSNNLLYPIINNLFLAVPFLLWAVYDRDGRAGDAGAAGCERNMRAGGGDGTFLWGAPFLMLVIFVLVQSVGFHLNFSFNDGINGEARDTRVTIPAKAAGVYTNQDNAAWLSELAAYTESEELTGREVILYGELPGLGYLLDMPSALSTFWADLDSYRMAEYERDLAQIDTPPVIIVSSPVAAYLNEDADGMNWFGVDREKMEADEKLQMLADYMTAHAYRESFGNGRYTVYVTE